MTVFLAYLSRLFLVASNVDLIVKSNGMYQFKSIFWRELNRS